MQIRKFPCKKTLLILKLTFREDTRLSQSDNDLNSLKEEIKTCYNKTNERIQRLATKIDQIDESLKDLIAQTKSSLENKINSVKSELNTKFLSVQNQVSDLNTNVDKMQTSLGGFEDSTNKGFSKVWEKFKEVDKEIANLPKNCGSLVCCYMRNYVIFYALIVLLFNVG
jgi:DNA anti-recombination protein RmuC